MRYVVIVAVALTGCAPSLISGNAAGGIVNSNFNMGQSAAMAKAEAHCQKFGKVARVSGQNELRNSITFDCVAG